MICILLLGVVAVVLLAAFALLVAGVHSTDRRKCLRDSSDISAARAFARRVLGVYVRQPEDHTIRDQVRR